MGDQLPATTGAASAFDLLARNEKDQHLYALACVYANSDLAPKGMNNKPANVFLALKLGQELGVAETQALQNIMVVNGRASVWGDLFLGIIIDSPKYEWHEESFEGTFPQNDFKAVCKFKRKGIEKPFEAEFSIEDAKTAHLWQKQGPWTNFPKRMLQMRARTFAGRDGFADAIKGVTTVEESRDIPTKYVEVQDVTERPRQIASQVDALKKELNVKEGPPPGWVVDGPPPSAAAAPPPPVEKPKEEPPEEEAKAPPKPAAKAESDVPPHMRKVPKPDKRAFDSLKAAVVEFCNQQEIGPDSEEYPSFHGIGRTELRAWYDAIYDNEYARPWLREAEEGLPPDSELSE